MSYEGYTTSPLVIYQNNAFTSGYGMSVTHGHAKNITNGGWTHGIEIGSDGAKNSGIRIDKTINLTAYNYLKVRLWMHAYSEDYLLTEKLTLAIATASNLTTSGFSKSVVKTISDTNLMNYDHILDVRSISGNYYIYILDTPSHTNCYSIVTKIWLENQ